MSFDRLLKVALAIFVLIQAVINTSCSYLKGSARSNDIIADSSIVRQTPANHIYGIPSDSFDVTEGKISANSYLPALLAKYGVSPQVLDIVVKNSKDVFDIRKMRAGQKYTLLLTKDSVPRAKFMIYEHEPSLYYIFSFNDSLKISPYRIIPETKIRFVSGEIQSSLWDAMINAGLNPELCVNISEMYAWTIDFFALQKGDSFRIMFRENYINGNSVGIAKIYGAEFTHGGKRYTAIPLIQNGIESYFDTTGNSLRRAFLKSPLQYARVSSRFSSGRMHPILRIVRPHFGVDYAAAAGTPVHSIGDGKVISAGTEEEAGRIVRIMHNSVYSTAYMHLSGFGNNIYKGASVKQGDIIGYVGSSGLATGPHLDFRFFKNGYAVDPLKVEAPPVEPVLVENHDKFNKTKTVVLSLLETIK
jgi:murein DD-endopeptidase MepM/ murein hydrolase activator NlpD